MAEIDTPALRALAASGIRHVVVRTPPAGSAEESASMQGVELRALLRTIVVRRADDDYVFVLVPAGRRFDWPRLRSALGVTRLSLPDADEARRVTGYERYTITPFGASRKWPVVVDASIVDLGLVAIGGGARGVNVHLAPGDLVAALGATIADVSAPEAQEPESGQAGSRPRRDQSTPAAGSVPEAGPGPSQARHPEPDEPRSKPDELRSRPSGSNPAT